MLAVVICLVFYFLNPTVFSKEAIAKFISNYSSYSWAVFLVIHIVRGFVLLPSTPLIFAGVILFPTNLLGVLIISLVGILFSSLLIYFFSDKLGFSTIFKRRNNKLGIIEKKLSGKNGYLYIMMWSFIPVVPTDLICYVSGALKIKIQVFMLSIFLGELALCSIYIYGSAFFIN